MTATTERPRTVTYQRPWLYAKQRDALFCPERYALVEASTKSGKTVGCIVWLFEQAALGKPGCNYWWVAPTFPVAQIAYRRMKRAVPRALYTPNDSDHTLTLANGTVVWFKGSERADTLYGEDVYAAVIDEATRCREDAWHAVRSTLTATRGPIRIIGNVKGRKNWAFRLARKAESGARDMHYAKLTAYDAVEGGVMAAEEVEDARDKLPAEVFGELYLAQPGDDAGNPFGMEAIRRHIAPLTDGAPVAWGWDLAKSQDWTWGIGLDASGAACRSERWQGPWELTLAKIRELTGTVPALVDSTGVGDPVLEALQRDGRRNFGGEKFTLQTKQQLMEGLAVAIQRTDSGLTYPDGALVGELEAFEYEYTRTGVRYSAPEGVHDDGVCALALAWARFTAPRPFVGVG